MKNRLAALLVFAFHSAHATYVAGDGATHTLNSSHDGVFIQNNSTVNLVSGAVVTGAGVQMNPAGFVQDGAVTVRSRTIDVSGNGRIVGGDGQAGIYLRGLQADIRMSDDSYVAGGDFFQRLNQARVAISANGFGTASSNRGPNAPTRLFLEDRVVVDGNVLFDGYVNISDDATINGRLTHGIGNLGIDMSGGLIREGVALGFAGNYDTSLSGGTILGGFQLGSSSFLNMNMSEGKIFGGLNSEGTLTADIRGGEIEGGINLMRGPGGAAGRVSVFGGAVNAALNGWLINTSGLGLDFLPATTFDIFGGQFGYLNSGQGIFLDGLFDLNVYGSGLAFDSGLLSGWLADGNWISVPLAFGSAWAGRFNLHNVSVPEPGTLMLMALGLLGIGFARRRRA